MVVILEADLSNKVSYHFSDYIHFYEKHGHKRYEAESRQKLRNRQAEFQTVTLKSCLYASKNLNIYFLNHNCLSWVIFITRILYI